MMVTSVLDQEQTPNLYSFAYLGHHLSTKPSSARQDDNFGFNYLANPRPSLHYTRQYQFCIKMLPQKDYKPEKQITHQ